MRTYRSRSEQRLSANDIAPRRSAVLWTPVEELVMVGRIGIDPGDQGPPLVARELYFLPVQLVIQQDPNQ